MPLDARDDWLIGLGDVEKVARGLKISHPDLSVDSDQRLLCKFH